MIAPGDIFRSGSLALVFLAGPALAEDNKREWVLKLEPPAVSEVESAVCPSGRAMLLSFEAALVDKGFPLLNRVLVRRGSTVSSTPVALQGSRNRVAEPRPASMTLTLCGSFPRQAIATAAWAMADGALGAPLSVEKVGLRYAVNTGALPFEPANPYALSVYAGPYDVTFDGEPGWLQITGGGVPTIDTSSSEEGG